MGTLQPLAEGDSGGYFAGPNGEPDAISTQKMNDLHTAFDSFVAKNEG